MMFAVVLSLLAVQGIGAIPHKWWSGPFQLVDPEINSRIINGVDAQNNQFPYMVSLNYQGDGHACGASVLTPNWILTAAHCCLTGSPMYVYAGSVVLSSGGKNYDISQYLIHGDYDPDNGWRNDICAIKLASNLQLGNTIQQVNLPSQDWPVNGGDNLLISGWGYTTSSGNQVIPDRMQVGYNFKALSNADCGSRTGVSMYDGYLCGQGGQGQGVCSGDSGSPLMKDNVQVGIASWVFLPCGSGAPDFYTRVPRYVNWIRQILGRDAQDLKIVS